MKDNNQGNRKYGRYDSGYGENRASKPYEKREGGFGERKSFGDRKPYERKEFQ